MSSHELSPDEDEKRTVEDDHRFYTYDDKKEKHHRRLRRVYDKTLGEGLTDKKAADHL